MPDNRTVRQFLQQLKSAGVSHLPLVRLAAAQPSAFRKSRKPGKSEERLAANVAPPKPAVAVASQPKSITRPAAEAETVALLQQTFASPEEKESGLSQLASLVARCQRCTELANTRRQTVFGVGNPDARIMFIGEAPGADEDRVGEPFVGAAGQLLDKIIIASGLKREDLYICNILRCRPPGNRNPLPQETTNCREYLDGQIQIVKPDYIICWGTVAAQNLLGEKSSVGRMRGRFMKHGDAKVLCTYHPSYLLRNPSAKKMVWEDMQFFMAELESDQA